MTTPWQELLAHHTRLKDTRTADLFKADAARFEKMSVRLPGLLFDYSKNLLDDEALAALVGFARKARIESAREAMFMGAKINSTENRAVLHTALRGEEPVEVDGKGIMPGVLKVLAQMETFSAAVREGKWRGYSGKEITDIVNIGIGGSSLGPQLVTEALSSFHHPRLRAQVVANVEAAALHHTLAKLSPETTLFIIASKTFTTAETMQNAGIARAWFMQASKDVAKHFVAVSTNAEAVKKFGIDPDNMFPFWDWVGGRYSVWSAIGLSVMLMVGAENFQSFLSGAREMDRHFRAAPLDKNIPVLMALIGVWHRNACDMPAYAVIPYHAGLRRFAAWLQQLDMESNGKSVDKAGRAVKTSGPIVFGEPGTDAQHSFFQWLHQGTDAVPVDFIGAVKPSCGEQKQQDMLLANLLAQGEALMEGQENKAEPHRHFPGNRPSNTILLDALNPHTLGMLLALYEHKIFVQGVIWNVQSFDQWGVELGKVLAKNLQAEIEAGKTGSHDGSTTGLLEHIFKVK